uniref:Uncharacterized protein n=1 Tax=Glossina austeni TaxID=7395 RepID=A0A1A9UET7_GLOAU
MLSLDFRHRRIGSLIGGRWSLQRSGTSGFLTLRSRTVGQGVVPAVSITAAPETADGDDRDVTVGGWREGNWLWPGLLLRFGWVCCGSGIYKRFVLAALAICCRWRDVAAFMFPAVLFSTTIVTAAVKIVIGISLCILPLLHGQYPISWAVLPVIFSEFFTISCRHLNLDILCLALDNNTLLNDCRHSLPLTRDGESVGPKRWTTLGPHNGTSDAHFIGKEVENMTAEINIRFSYIIPFLDFVTHVIPFLDFYLDTK